MLAPPMCLDLRYSFEGIILGFASGRKRWLNAAPITLSASGLDDQI
jgi:hypothetical protein